MSVMGGMLVQPPESRRATGRQAVMVVICPGMMNVITPPQAQWHWELFWSAGWPPIITVGEPGVHGVVTGMHGIGVRTPRAAVVAAATCGLDRVVHMPKGATLTIGLKSMMLAAGCPPLVTRLSGKTLNTDGATPNEHRIWAPLTTCTAMD
jgi:hypothetical protein